MWLVHTFFCYYLFHDWIYGSKYPIVIYAVTVLVSYFTGCLIDKINLPVQRYELVNYLMQQNKIRKLSTWEAQVLI